MEESFDRVLAHLIGNAVYHGQIDLGSALIVFVLILGGIAFLRHAIKEAKKGTDN